MFRDSSAHLQEDTVVHVQHMLLSLVIFYMNFMYYTDTPYKITALTYI